MIVDDHARFAQDEAYYKRLMAMIDSLPRVVRDVANSHGNIALKVFHEQLCEDPEFVPERRQLEQLCERRARKIESNHGQRRGPA